MSEERREELNKLKENYEIKAAKEELARVIKINNDRMRWKKNQGVLTKENKKEILKTAKTAEEIRKEYLRISERMGDEVKKEIKLSNGVAVITTKREAIKVQRIIRKENKMKEKSDTIARKNGNILRDENGNPVHVITADKTRPPLTLPEENGKTQEEIQREYDYLLKDANKLTDSYISYKDELYKSNLIKAFEKGSMANEDKQELVKMIKDLKLKTVRSIYENNELSGITALGYSDEQYERIRNMIIKYS